jgi:hypothetical protein
VEREAVIRPLAKMDHLTRTAVQQAVDSLGLSRTYSPQAFSPRFRYNQLLSVHLLGVLTQVWCNTNGLENSRGEQTSAEQFEAGAAIHLPFEGFQPVDVTFHRTVAERLL